jgi:hypothetical protein
MEAVVGAGALSPLVSFLKNSSVLLDQKHCALEILLLACMYAEKKGGELSPSLVQVCISVAELSEMEGFITLRLVFLSAFSFLAIDPERVPTVSRPRVLDAVASALVSAISPRIRGLCAKSCCEEDTSECDRLCALHIFGMSRAMPDVVCGAGGVAAMLSLLRDYPRDRVMLPTIAECLTYCCRGGVNSEVLNAIQRPHLKVLIDAVASNPRACGVELRCLAAVFQSSERDRLRFEAAALGIFPTVARTLAAAHDLLDVLAPACVALANCVGGTPELKRRAGVAGLPAAVLRVLSEHSRDRQVAAYGALACENLFQACDENVLQVSSHATVRTLMAVLRRHHTSDALVAAHAMFGEIRSAAPTNRHAVPTHASSLTQPWQTPCRLRAPRRQLSSHTAKKLPTAAFLNLLPPPPRVSPTTSSFWRRRSGCASTSCRLLRRRLQIQTDELRASRLDGVAWCCMS